VCTAKVYESVISTTEQVRSRARQWLVMRAVECISWQ